MAEDKPGKVDRRPERVPHGAMVPGQKFNKNVAKRLLKYIGKYKVRFTLVLFCILISVIASVMSSLFLSSLIDDYILPLVTSQSNDFSGLAHMLLVMGGIFFSGALASLIYNWTMVTISQGIQKKIRDDMFEHMQTLPIRYFDTHTYGDVMSHYTNDTDTLRQMLSQTIPQLFSSLVSVIVFLVSMLYLSVNLTLFTLGFTVLMMFVMTKVGGQSGKYFMRQQASLGKVDGYIEEMINGEKVIKVFNHEKDACEGFDTINEELRNDAANANIYANILMPIMGAMGYLLYVGIAIVGGYMAISGGANLSLSGAGVMSLGMIASFLQMSRNFVNPITQIAQQINSVVMALAGAERIFNLMDEQPEGDGGYVTLANVKRNADGTLEEVADRTDLWAWKDASADGKVSLTELKGDIRMHDVDFGYEPKKQILYDISLFAKPGQKIAFVGATGAGKTTITNLLNRFYDISQGSITYDGIDISKIRKSDLRSSLGIVPQDVNLFTGTVMENIRYGRLDATDEECIEAAKLANAHDFIEMLPDGYNTVLEGDGSGLSQGQRQLLSIARCAVADPPVMILDEATSSIDTRTEAIVQRGMDSIMKDRTVFVIAHRLSTVQNANAIMVLDHGHIIERGDHEELLAQKGVYYQLCTGAFELE